MPNKNAKKEKESEEVLSPVSASLEVKPPTLKEELEGLYTKLKEHGVNSIGDLEVKISRL